jgi:hypothetical protein
MYNIRLRADDDPDPKDFDLVDILNINNPSNDKQIPNNKKRRRTLRSQNQLVKKMRVVSS